MDSGFQQSNFAGFRIPDSVTWDEKEQHAKGNLAADDESVNDFSKTYIVDVILRDDLPSQDNLRCSRPVIETLKTMNGKSF